jgi:hypothetical protein
MKLIVGKQMYALLRGYPTTNVLGAVNDANAPRFGSCEKLHAVSPNKRDVFQIEEDGTLLFLVQQLLQPFRMFIVHFSAQHKNSRLTLN